MVARWTRPYPPGRLRINSAAYPDAIGSDDILTLAWGHRDRVLQGDLLVEEGQADIDPESGTTYNLKLYGEDGALKRTVTGLTGTTYAWETEFIDGGKMSIGDALLCNFTSDLADLAGNTTSAVGDVAVAATGVAAMSGNALALDTDGKFVRVADSLRFNLARFPFTLEATFCVTAETMLATILAPDNASQSGSPFFARNDSSDNVLLGIGATQIIASASSTMTVGEVAHWCVQRDAADTFYLYKNGKLLAQRQMAINVDFRSASGLLIGRNGWGGGSGQLLGFLRGLDLSAGGCRYALSGFTPRAVPMAKTGAIRTGLMRSCGSSWIQSVRGAKACKRTM
jgi:hypothetical protein